MFIRDLIKTNSALWIGFVMALMATVLLMAPSAHAATTTNNANTLRISPVRSDIQIKAGETQTVKVNVTNQTNGPLLIRPYENDFVSGDESGTPALILDADKFAPTHSLKRFMKPLNDVTIPAKQAKVIEVSITVPKDAQPGGYFGALRFAPSSTDGGGQVNLSGSVASLILLTVPGPAVEKLNLSTFDIQQNGTAGTFFQSSNDLSILTRFENKGSVQQGPFGKISVKQGDKLVYDTDFNNKDPRDVILPDSVRRWTVPLKNIGSFGHYTVTATLTYGTKNQTIEVSKSFWVVPLGVIIGAIVGVLVLIGLIVGIVIFLRGYKKRVLRKHGGGGGGLRF